MGIRSLWAGGRLWVPLPDLRAAPGAGTATCSCNVALAVGPLGRGRALPLASSSSADLVPCFLLGFTSFVQMAPLSLL